MKTKSNTKAYLTFAGGVETVTGANFLFEYKDKKILIDCGFIQGSSEAEKPNWDPFPYDPSAIDILLVTHSHLDHVGRIPKLIKDGFKGVIYSTQETRDISRLILADALGLSQNRAKELNLPYLYDEKNVDRAFSLWKTLPYHQKINLIEDLSIELFDAGHILGSSMFRLSNETSSILFTGDLGNSPSPLLRDTEYVNSADYVVMESVYGDRLHESREDRALFLKDMLTDVIANKGTLLIPAFSVERTQTLLYEINNFVESGLIPRIPIFLDSPLAIDVTEIYRNGSEEFNETAQAQIKRGDDIFNFPGLTLSKSKEHSKMITTVHPPKVIIAGSGMAHGGRMLFHLARYLPDPNNIVLFVGYQSPGSLGRLIEEGKKTVDIFDSRVSVNARVEVIKGYSGHKDRDGLIDFVSHIKEAKKVFCVMGEPKSAMFLAQRINDYLNLDAKHPGQNEKIELDF